jgi:Flp pilus assembly protein TadD
VKEAGKWISLLGMAGLLALAADLDTGIKQFQQGDYGKAVDTLREYVQENPDDLKANYYLGASLVQLKQYKEAMPYLEKSAESDPEAKLELGHAQLMQNQIDEAMKTLDGVEADSSNLHLYRGMAYLKRNENKQAAEELSKALELDEKNAYAHYYMGITQGRLKRPDLMTKEFELFLQLAPNAPEAPQARSLLRTR